MVKLHFSAQFEELELVSKTLIKTIFLATLGMGMFLSISVFEEFRSGETITFETFVFEFIEAAVLFGAVAATALMAIEAKKGREQSARLVTSVEQAQFDGTQWRTLAENYVAGLGHAISGQFKAWNFTESEAEIAMLMLKGFSHKEIAGLRLTNEATVRQQASAVYRKSNLKNHRELSAFFLEDLTPSLGGPGELSRRSGEIFQ